ncbi:MAG: hypothetical protein K2X55_10815 [Burkholderiaceae bacterium]|nr:hypothetical protein [Burkholderiaceae bacterium]MBY0239792.1 hypothetical protein [Burkholderiaceae bacterium]
MLRRFTLKIERFSMLKMAVSLLLTFLLTPVQAASIKCEVEAQVKEVMIQNCDGERFLGRAIQDGELANPTPFDAISLGIEKFWSDICQCYLWQVSGIAGAHTHIVRFFQNGANGGFTLIPGGEFGSEIGKISRISQTSGFIVEVRDSDVSGKRRTLERFRFDGRKFVKIK